MYVTIFVARVAEEIKNIYEHAIYSVKIARKCQMKLIRRDKVDFCVNVESF